MGLVRAELERYPDLSAALGRFRLDNSKGAVAEQLPKFQSDLVEGSVQLWWDERENPGLTSVRPLSILWTTPFCGTGRECVGIWV